MQVQNIANKMKPHRKISLEQIPDNLLELEEIQIVQEYKLLNIMILCLILVLVLAKFYNFLTVHDILSDYRNLQNEIPLQLVQQEYSGNKNFNRNQSLQSKKSSTNQYSFLGNEENCCSCSSCSCSSFSNSSDEQIRKTSSNSTLKKLEKKISRQSKSKEDLSESKCSCCSVCENPHRRDIKVQSHIVRGRRKERSKSSERTSLQTSNTKVIRQKTKSEDYLKIVMSCNQLYSLLEKKIQQSEKKFIRNQKFIYQRRGSSVKNEENKKSKMYDWWANEERINRLKQQTNRQKNINQKINQRIKQIIKRSGSRQKSKQKSESVDKKKKYVKKEAKQLKEFKLPIAQQNRNKKAYEKLKKEKDNLKMKQKKKENKLNKLKTNYEKEFNEFKQKQKEKEKKQI